MNLDARLRKNIEKRYRSIKKSMPDDIRQSVVRFGFLSGRGPLKGLGMARKPDINEETEPPPMLNLTVHIEHQRNGREIESAIADKTRRIVTNILSAHGYGGIWRLTPIVRQPLNTEEFVAKSITQRQNQHGIKLWTAVGNSRDGAWESTLWPPSNYDIQDVFASLSGKPIAAPTAKPAPKPTPAPPSPPPIPPSNEKAKFVRPGLVFAGTVVTVTKTVCQVEVCSGVYGKLPNTEWDFRPCDDLTLVVEDGDEVKVMVMDEELNLSRKSAMESTPANVVEVLNSFNELPDKSGNLALTKYMEDDKRVRFLLEALAECYPAGKGLSHYGHYVPSILIRDTWATALKTRYNAKSISTLGPIFKTMLCRELIAEYPPNSDSMHRLGYYLTDYGWRCVGGPEAVDMDAAIVYRYLNKSAPPSQVVEAPPPAPVQAAPPAAPPPPEPSRLIASNGSSGAAAIVEYVEKQKALTSIADQIIALQLQHDELAAWLDAHAALGREVQHLKALLS